MKTLLSIIRAPPPNTIRIANSYGNNLSEIKVEGLIAIQKNR